MFWDLEWALGAESNGVTYTAIGNHASRAEERRCRLACKLAVGRYLPEGGQLFDVVQGEPVYRSAVALSPVAVAFLVPWKTIQPYRVSTYIQGTSQGFLYYQGSAPRRTKTKQPGQNDILNVL